MATTHTDTNVNQLVINKMTKQEYDNLSQVSETELYLVEEQVDSTVTQGSTNPVQSGAVYDAIQNIEGTINDGTTTFTKNSETIGTTSANQSANQTIALPNDVVMCNLIDNKALASYATPITRFKYIEDHGWVDMDRSNIQYNEGTGEWTGTFVSLDITEGEYYYDMDNDTVFVADENSEMQDVTSTVVIQDDINKLYCDVDTNILYRYDGTNFVALTSNFSGDYNDLINKPDLNFLKQRDLTTYQGENNEIVQHVGSNSSGYINGYVYKKSNVHSLTYNGATYTYIGETDDNVTWELYKITQDNIDYVVPQKVNIGDNFWVVRDFTTLEVVHIFEIDNISDNVGGTQMNVEGHFLGTNITLHFVAPYSEITHTSKALVYKNGNNYLYCDSTFRFFASSVNNNNANVIPFDGTVNNAYAWQRVNVQPNQLSLENSEVKYTLNDGTTKLTLIQESDYSNIAIEYTPDTTVTRDAKNSTTLSGLKSYIEASNIEGIAASRPEEIRVIRGNSGWYEIGEFYLHWGVSAIFDCYVVGNYGNVNWGSVKFTIVVNAFSVNVLNVINSANNLTKVRLLTSDGTRKNPVTIEIYKNNDGEIVPRIRFVGLPTINTRYFVQHDNNKQVWLNSEYSITM